MADDNRADHIRQARREDASSNTYSDTSKSSGNSNKRYVNHLKDRSKPTCLIHGPGNSSDECKVLWDFVSKYTKKGLLRNTHNILHIEKNGKYQENNVIVHHAVDEMILQEKEKLHVKDKSHEKIDDKVDEDELYELE